MIEDALSAVRRQVSISERGLSFYFQRLIEQSRVTCIRWIPGTPNLFLVSYSSGFMYVYNHELVCPPAAPAYQVFLQGEGYSIHTCKTKTTR